MELEQVLEYIDKMDIRALIMMSIICIIFDILTGYLKAFKSKKINSSISRDGYIKKLTWFVAILIGLAFEYFLQIGLIFYMSIAVCCITELISITENMCELNPAFNIFKKYLDIDRINKE